MQTIVKVIFEDNDYFITKINLPKEEAKKYYLNNVFTFGNSEAYEYKNKVIQVDILEENN